jgi:uncharacterized protein
MGFVKFFLLPALAFAFQVSEIPNPRAISRWVVDNAAVMTYEERTQVEAALEKIHQQTSAEVAVVTLPSIGSLVPKAVATELFQAWKIGVKGRDNGLLLLLVTDQRRLEIETGYGLEGVLPDAVLSRIQREVMVPELKARRPGQAFLKGLDRIGAILEAHKEEVARPAYAPSLYFKPKYYPFSITALLNLIALILLIRLWATADPDEVHARLTGNFSFLFFWQASCFSLPVEWLFHNYNMATMEARPWGGVIIGTLWFSAGELLKYFWLSAARKKPRQCKECGKVMVLQTAEQKKALQSPSEQVEEEIGASEYDYWVCPNQHVLKLFYAGRYASRYQECPKCCAKAAKLISDKVQVFATQASAGRGERILSCAACKLESVKPYVIPMLAAPSSFSDSGSSSDSSSDSGGDSFGGGSSGGGGAGSDY